MGNFRAIILDFETTGLSPDRGDRTIEIGAVVVEDGVIVGRIPGTVYLTPARP